MNKGQVHELVNEAISLWVEISGVDPEQRKFRIGGSGVVKDPWKKLRFTVVIPISRRAFKKLRKEFGLPPVNFDEWPERNGW